MHTNYKCSTKVFETIMGAPRWCELLKGLVCCWMFIQRQHHSSTTVLGASGQLAGCLRETSKVFSLGWVAPLVSQLPPLLLPKGVAAFHVINHQHTTTLNNPVFQHTQGVLSFHSCIYMDCCFSVYNSIFLYLSCTLCCFITLYSSGGRSTSILYGTYAKTEIPQFKNVNKK